MNLRYKIRLIPKNSFIVGGKKLNNDYIKSLNLVPGSVLRAALSKEITLRCAYDEESNKNYWVQYKDKEECKECSVKNLCKNFSQIKIGQSLPLNSKLYPLTAMTCKDDHSHGAFDTLADRINMKINNIDNSHEYVCSKWVCEKCDDKNGRSERCDGMYIEENDRLKDISMVNLLTTKNMINPYTRTAKDGVLYSLDSVATSVMVEEEERELYLEGFIEGENIETDLKALDYLYVGAYNSAGYGKMKFEILGEDKENLDNLKKRVVDFNKFINNKDKLYIPITLKSDGYFNIENCSDKALYEIETEEYINFYKENITQLKEFGEIFYMILSNEIRRGFDTSGKTVRLRKSKRVIKAGGIFVLEIDRDKIDYERLFNLQKNGIGENTEHGFGQVIICDNFHVNKYKDNGGK